MMRQVVSLIVAVLSAMITGQVDACTSAIISGKVSRSGRPLLWKHRDTSHDGNFVQYVPAVNGNHAYEALFNSGDSLLAEAWMGMNDAGFAIMNTASYNLAPDTASVKDREGLLMSRALQTCASLADFETLLDTLPRPMGVQANFGVIDASGAGAFYETDDNGSRRFMLEEAPHGVLIRTNYSCSGDKDCGYGYIRSDNAGHFIIPAAERHDVTPELLTDTVSRSFYHSLIGRDLSLGDAPYIIDQDFVPRATSTASVVIEGVNRGESPRLMIMWTALGYPPASHVEAVTPGCVPMSLRPDPGTWRSPFYDEVAKRKGRIFDIVRGNGGRYINVKALNEISSGQHAVSLDNYRRGRIANGRLKKQLKK